MHRTTIKVTAVLFALCLAGMGCKKDDAAGPPSETVKADTAGTDTKVEEPTAPTPPADGVGTITGKVTLDGDAPKMAEINRKSDPFCAKTAKTAVFVRAEAGMLQDVLVRLPVGAAKGEVPTTPVAINQTECMYEPFVVGAVSGQNLAIKNSDKTMHNVHTYEGDETLFNQAQPPGSPDLASEVESDGGAVLRLTCDVHKWMTAHVVVTDHPFFSVSAKDGTFKIENVPAGEYELEAWHPYLGLQKAKVTVTKDATAEIAFAFKAADYKAPTE